MQTQIYDGAANLWRTVVVDSVAVRWIDLGTKLVLRHVVRVLGAEQEGHSRSTNNNQNETESDSKGVPEGGDTGETSGPEGGAKAGALTAEVDLDEVRWAECTGREKERRLSKPNAKKLAGNPLP